VGELGGLDELGPRSVLPERLQIGVAELEHVRAAGGELEPVDERPQGDDKRVEWMRHAAVAPVEEEVAAVAYEHIAVV